MFSLTAPLWTIVGLIMLPYPCFAQTAPWPPPAGMSAGEYLQRHGRQYNPYTGYDPNRDDRERLRAYFPL